MQYKILLMYDDDYKGYVVDVPELVGCMSQGKTMDEAIKNVKDAIEGWLYVENKHNRNNYTEIKEMFIGEVTV